MTAILLALVPAVPGAAATTGLDPSFGTGGIVRFDGPVAEGATAVAVQSDGKLVVVGAHNVRAEPQKAIVTRLLPDGALDTTFGTGGRVLLDDGPNRLWATGVAVRPDGRIVVSMSWGRADHGASRVQAVQLTATGQVDTSWGQGGFVFGPDGVVVNTTRSALALQPDGKVLLANNVYEIDTDSDMYVARFNADGTPDSGFGESGLARIDFSTPGAERDDFGNTMALMEDGRIVVGGQSHPIPYTRSAFALARLTPTGLPDPTFGSGGRVVTELALPGLPGAAVVDLAAQPDGGVVAIGVAFAVQANQFVVARYTDAGGLDGTFGTGGLVNVGNGWGYAVGLDAGGRIVAGGELDGDFGVVRLLPSGGFDPTFGTDGRLVTDVTDSKDEVLAIALQPDGKIVAAGHSGERFTVARYRSESEPPDTSDYDGDGRSDIGVYRPSTGVWYIDRSGGGMTAVHWGGAEGDLPSPGDFDGDGRTDVAIFRASTGIWYVNRSGGGTTILNWGADGDVPTPADFDGDGRTDIAVYWPSTGIWYVQHSGGGTTILNWGSPGDVPTTGDYDGDGKDDIAVYRPSSGDWYVNGSTAGLTVVNWGGEGYLPVAGDYDGDGRTDIAVFHASTGIWYVNRSGGGTTVLNWGSPGDIPTAADYDGDGKDDVAVFRPSTAIWYVNRSSGGMTVLNWGVESDVPVS